MFLVHSNMKLVLFKKKHAERDFHLNVITTGLSIVLCFMLKCATHVVMCQSNGIISFHYFEHIFVPVFNYMINVTY